MEIADIIAIAVILAIIIGIIVYIYRAKKRGAHCIGCPNGGCGKKCDCGKSDSRTKRE